MIFELRCVVRTFRARGRADVHALDRVSLSVARGDLLAVTGPSGCGKTTLLSLLGALDRPTEGDVLFRGGELGRASGPERSRVRRRMGIVFQHSYAIRRLPVWENVSYPLVPLGVRAAERRRRAREALGRVGILDRADARPEELSGGERQRLGVARALVGDPDVVLADEPTSNLDRETAAAVVRIFRELRDAGRTVVVATHDPELEDLATRRCRLRAGRIEAPR